MRAAFHVAQEVDAGLGTGEILLEALRRELTAGRRRHFPDCCRFETKRTARRNVTAAILSDMGSPNGAAE